MCVQCECVCIRIHVSLWCVSVFLPALACTHAWVGVCECVRVYMCARAYAFYASAHAIYI